MADKTMKTGGTIGRRGVLLGAVAGGAVLAAPGILRASDVLRIGWVRPLTGPMASSFVGNFAAGDIALEEINARGGILGRKLEKFEVDDAGSPAQQPIALRQLAEEQINIVVGPVGSSQTLAALAVSTPAEMLHCGYITASDGGDGRRYPFHYQCSFTVAAQAVLYADFLKARGVTKAGVLVEDSAAGTSVLDALQRELPARGLTLTGSRVSPLRSNDMTPFLRDLRAGGAEALCVFVANAIDATQVFVGLDRLSWQPLIVGHTGLFYASSAEAIPPAGRYADVYGASYRSLTFAPGQEPDARLRGYIDRILGFGLADAALAPAATSPFYDFLHVVAAGAEATGSLDSGKIKGWLDQMRGHKGIFGDMSFTAENHTAYGPGEAAMAQVFPDASPLYTTTKGLFRPRG